MRNYVAVVFDGTTSAYKGLHALWQLDRDGTITVHGTAVVHRNAWGQFQIDSKETHPAFATAVGVGVGALLGALAGPAGAAAGAAIGAAEGAAMGAAVGGVIGISGDMIRADSREAAFEGTALILNEGQSAVIADVSEDSASEVNNRMRELGATVRRRAASTLRDDAFFGAYVPGSYLYPYEYVPRAYLL
jgi:uncharacterized membrane protein